MTGSAMTGPPSSERWSSWQALDSGRLLLMSTAAMLVLAAFATATISVQHVEKKTALAFGGFIALGELLRLALPGGREAAPIAMVGGLSYALLINVGPSNGHTASGSPQPASALMVIAVAAIGMMVGSLPHIAAGRPAGLTGMCTRLVAIACVAFVFRPAGYDFLQQHNSWSLDLAVMTPLVLLGWLADTIVGALIRAVG